MTDEHACKCQEPSAEDFERRIRDLEAALRPFADAVFNDNGDVTFETSRIGDDDYWRAYRVMYRKPIREAAERRKPDADEHPHEVIHIYEGDGALIVREGTLNMDLIGVRHPALVAGFNSVQPDAGREAAIEAAARDFAERHGLDHPTQHTLENVRFVITAYEAHRGGGAVRVKPLEWAKSEITAWNGDWHTVPTAYTVRCADENGWKWRGFGDYGYERSPEDAKVAAQADYERRILSAIEGGGAVAEPMETAGPYEARICKGIPADCCDYGVISLSEGQEVCRVWREQDARAIAAALSAIEGGGAVRYRHKRRGTDYELIGYGNMQSKHWRDPATPADNCLHGTSVNLREVAIYRSVDEGALWVRPREEFEDGRFEEVKS
ncbi:hypothetical protein [Rhodoligotrophos ferricapiens]|uniref:hypothetical protein n=1 Tax=Rhodoligotrophos ferricapiens TaxID=3069264 RepID=UPI00315CC357